MLLLCVSRKGKWEFIKGWAHGFSLSIYERTHTHCGIDRECNSTEQNGRRRRRGNRKKERKRRGWRGWVDRIKLLSLHPPHPLRLSLSLSVLLDNISDKPEEKTGWQTLTQLQSPKFVWKISHQINKLMTIFNTREMQQPSYRVS